LYLHTDIQDLKDRYSNKLIKEKTYMEKCKAWIKEPDNAWKIFTLFASPILALFLVIG